jgi:hypothetical protein
MPIVNNLLALGTGYLGGTSAGKDQGYALQAQQRQLAQADRRLGQQDSLLGLQRDQFGLQQDQFGLEKEQYANQQAELETQKQVMAAWSDAHGRIRSMIDPAENPELYLAETMQLYQSEPLFSQYLPADVSSGLDEFAAQIGSGPAPGYKVVGKVLIRTNADGTETVAFDARGKTPQETRLTLLDVFGDWGPEAQAQHEALHPELYQVDRDAEAEVEAYLQRMDPGNSPNLFQGFEGPGLAEPTPGARGQAPNNPVRLRRERIKRNLEEDLYGL